MITKPQRNSIQVNQLNEQIHAVEPLAVYKEVWFAPAILDKMSLSGCEKDFKLSYEGSHYFPKAKFTVFYGPS